MKDNMLKLQRLLLKDNQGNLCKLLNFGSSMDKHHEPYLKICVPHFKEGAKLYSITHSSEMTDTSLDQYSFEQKSINEFTYHYQSGVSHLKFGNERLRQLRNLPTIQSSKPFLLVTIYLFDLDQVQKFKNETKNSDFVLPNEFNSNNGRIVDIYLGQVGIGLSIPDKSDINYLGQYAFEEEEQSIGLCILDYEFKNKPNKTGIMLSRPRDPQGKLL